MHAGFDSGPLVGDADLIIVIESDAPWYPGMQQPAAGCRVAHIGEDPIFAAIRCAGCEGRAIEVLPRCLTRRCAWRGGEAQCRRAARNCGATASGVGKAEKKNASVLEAQPSAAPSRRGGSDALIFNEFR